MPCEAGMFCFQISAIVLHIQPQALAVSELGHYGGKEQSFLS